VTADAQPVLPPPVAAFWRDACARHGIDPAGIVHFSMFGTPQIADELAALVCIGQKRATAGLLESYALDGDPLPVLGGHLVVTSAAGVPVALVRTVRLDTFAFRDVPAWFAEREGEDEGQGEVCLAAWKAGHGAFFRRECAEQGRVFDESMQVVCESFDIVDVHPQWRALLQAA
jgi:uncharacterized protein YhfF